MANNYDIFKKLIKKNYKVGIEEKLDNSKVIINKTGSLTLDMALCSPIPNGTIVETRGEVGSAKSSLALEIAANAIIQGKIVGYVDAERSLTESLIRSIRNLDIDKKDEEGNPLFIRLPGKDNSDVANLSAETYLNIIDNFLDHFPKSVIILDSVDALIPKAKHAEAIGTKTKGGSGYVMSDAIRRFTAKVPFTDSVAIFINHINPKINPYQKGDNTTGGEAVKRYSRQIIRLKSPTKDDLIKDDNGKVVGHKVEFTIVKNKFGPPLVDDYFPLIYGKGIDHYQELSDLSARLIFPESGNRYQVGESLLYKKQIEEKLISDKEFYNDIYRKICKMIYSE